MVNRLGQRNGDMPRYLVWKENAKRMRGQPCDRIGQSRRIGRHIQLAAALERQTIDRIEPPQIDMILQARSTRREDLAQDARVEKECRPKIEPVTFTCHHRLGATAYPIALLEHDRPDTGLCPQQRCGEASRTRTDNRHSCVLPPSSSIPPLPKHYPPPPETAQLPVVGLPGANGREGEAVAFYGKAAEYSGRQTLSRLD